MATDPVPPEDYEDYFSEIVDIEQGTTDSGNNEEELSKTPDEGEQEVAWLKDAGYGDLASRFEEGKELDNEFLEGDTSLTKAQAQAVKKRIDTLNATIRKKQKQQHKTDVRDIFNQPPNDAGASSHLPARSISDVRSPRRGASSREVPHLKNRGGYSFNPDNVTSEGTVGIETLSIHSSQHIGGSVPAASAHYMSNVQVNLSVRGSPQLVKTSKSTASDGLPDIIPKRDVLGLTRVDDLASSDLIKIRRLALMELTSLFDLHNITYTRRKVKRRWKDHGVYGIPLHTLLEQNQRKYPYLKVPLLVQQMLRFLHSSGIHEEGILRVPGSAARIKALRQEIEEKFSTGLFHWEEVRPNDAAGLLKQYLRELPIPLLTAEYLEAFAQVDRIPDIKGQIQALNLLVLLLPDVNRDTLHMLVSFLRRVADNIENLMTLSNVAMIMAPNLFLMANPRGNRGKPIKEIEIKMAAGTSKIVMMMIKYQDMLWTVPSFLVQQMRHQNDVEHMKRRDKSIIKFLSRGKEKSEQLRKPTVLHEADFKRGVIRVQAPQMTKVHTAVQLQPGTLAGEIVARFSRHAVKSTQSAPPGSSAAHFNGRNRRDSTEDELESGMACSQDSLPDNVHLYEIGGNIGQRRLDHSTNMLELYSVNPNAEWVVQKQYK